MKRMGQIARLLVFALIVAASGCESIALWPRPDIDDTPERRAQRGTSGDVRGRTGVPQDEIVGTVERIDKANTEIQLRTTEARVITVKYDQTTRVYSREREVGIDALRPRDLILMRVSKTSSGEQYADLIRLNDRGDVGSKGTY